MADARTRPVPAHIRLLNRRQDAPAPSVDSQEPRRAHDVPSAPSWLDDDARQEWDRLAPLLADGWREQFGDSLAVYAVLLVQFRRKPELASPAMLSQLRLLQTSLGLNPRAHAALQRERK